MAKPGTAPTQWATDATFSSGPRSGDATKAGMAAAAAQGFVPGDTAKSPTLNEVLNMITGWLAWVNDGSAAEDEDAHIVETDSDGRINVWAASIAHGTDAGFGLEITGAAVSGTALARVQYTGAAAGYSTVQATSNATGDGRAFDGTFSGTGAAGSVFYGNAVTQAVGVFVAECSNNDTPGFALAEVPTGCGDIRLAERSTDPTSPAGGDLWCVNDAAAAADRGDPLRLRSSVGSPFTQYVHSSPIPHLLARGLKNPGTSSVSSRTSTSYLTVATASYQGRGSDTVFVRAKISLSVSTSTTVNVRIVNGATVIDSRAISTIDILSTSTSGEDMDFFLTGFYTEVSGGNQVFSVQFNENGSATAYCARAEIVVTRGFQDG